MMRNKRIIFATVFLLFTTSLFAQQKQETPLSQEHKKWLEEVYWIISDYEKEAFISLQKVEDRNLFIKAFWEDRDPTPGTAKNEFREEHYERLQYANKQFGRESSMPGWKTDRGKVYILLGKPQFVVRNPGGFELQPVELWQYVGTGYGLPSSLYFMFFQKHGAGAYKLYSPLNDGVKMLFKPLGALAGKSEEDLHEYLYDKVSKEIAHASLSALPNEGGLPGQFGTGSASVTTEVVYAKLENARNYNFQRRTYVEDILKDRPTVKVYYSIGTDKINAGLFWFLGPNGSYYFDYAIQYEPEKMDMGQFEDDYYTSISVDGQITNAGTEIDQIVHTNEIKINKTQFNTVKQQPFQYQLRKPILPGKHGITLVASNNVSRQSTTFTHDVDIPEQSTMKSPCIPPLLPVGTIETVANNDRKVRPFQFGEKVYTPNIAARYSQAGNMQVFHQLIFPDKVEDSPLLLVYKVAKNDLVEASFEQELNQPTTELDGASLEILKDIPLKDLSLGNKLLQVELQQNGKVLSRSLPLPFTVTNEQSPGVWKYFVSLPDFDSTYHQYAIAQQLMKLKKPEEAVLLLQQALQKDPEVLQIRIELMRASFASRNYERVLEIGRPAEVKHPRNRQLLWLMGWANYQTAHYQDAIRFFERYRIEDPDRVEALNVLADSYLRNNQPDKSKEVLEKSLALKPDQKDVLELKKKLENQ